LAFDRGGNWFECRKGEEHADTLADQLSEHGPLASIEAVVREKAAKLDRFFERIVGCDVTVEAPHRHHHKGKLYKVRIDIGMPGNDVHVNQEGPKNQAHEDVYVAIRDAFDAAVRQLEDHARKLRGDVKSRAS
jgi:ribosomal subunit interface protein